MSAVRLGALASGLLLIVTLAGCVSNAAEYERKKAPHEAASYNVQLGIAYLQSGDLASAKEKIERALEQDPSNPDVHRAAALLYDRLNNESRADKHYQTWLRLKPKDPEARNNYGVFLCRHGRADEGDHLFIEAAHDPLYRTPETAYLNAGLCLVGAKKYDEAIQRFETALQIKPKYRDAMVQLGELYFDRGQMPQAQQVVQRYIQVTGGASAEILWLGVRVERALGNRGVAEAYARRLKTEYPTTEQTRALIASERKPG